MKHIQVYDWFTACLLWKFLQLLLLTGRSQRKAGAVRKVF